MTFPAPAPTPTPRYYKNLGGNNMDGHLTCLESLPSFRPPLLAVAVILAPWVHLPTSENPYRYRYRYLGTEKKKKIGLGLNAHVNMYWRYMNM